MEQDIIFWTCVAESHIGKKGISTIAIVDGLIICGINNLVCSDAGLLMLLFMCAVLSISETNQNTVKGERRR